MGFNVSNISEGIRTITHDHPTGGDPLVIVYRPGGVSVNDLKDLRARAIAADAPGAILPEVDGLEMLAEALSRTIVEWTLTDADDVPVETSVEGLCSLDIPVLNFIQVLIDTDQEAAGKELASSAAGSRPKVPGKAKKAVATTRRTNG